MQPTVEIALIAATPPTIVGIAALIVAMKTKVKVQDVHLSINSRMDQLVQASKAQGRQDERDAHSVTVEGVPRKEEPQ